MPEAIRLTPDERRRYGRGRTHFERGEVEPALESLNELLQTRDGFADVHYMRGVMLDRRGELDAAAESLGRAIHLNPAYVEALLALASVTGRQGDFDRSEQLADRAASLSRAPAGALDATTRGKLANLQAAVGDACAEAGELREAAEAYRKALDRCPDYCDIRYRLAVTLREAGLPDRALRELRRVLRANPDFLEAQVQLGLTYYTLGRCEDALAQWRQVLARDSSREDARMYCRLVAPKATGDATRQG